MSPDLPTFKVLEGLNTWSKWILLIDILIQILLTIWTFIALNILRIVSIRCWWFLFGVCYYVSVQFTH